MSLDKAALSLVKLRPDTFLENAAAAGSEIRDKAFNPPATSNAAIKGLKVLDCVVHAGAATAHVLALSVGLPDAHYFTDAATMAYGYLKFFIGKIGEKQTGKGGWASDVKASGRLSIAASAISFGAGITRNIPLAGPYLETGLGAAAHAGASIISMRHAVAGASVVRTQEA